MLFVILQLSMVGSEAVAIDRAARGSSTSRHVRGAVLRIQSGVLLRIADQAMTQNIIPARVHKSQAAPARLAVPRGELDRLCLVALGNQLGALRPPSGRRTL